MQIEATCEFCRNEPETVTHVLWSYPFARNVWALIRGRVQKCSNEAEDFFLMFKHLQHVVESADLDRWAVTTWSIWSSRNKYYFEHIQQEPRSIMEKATGLITVYQTLMAAQQVWAASYTFQCLEVFFFIIAIHGDTLEMWAVSLPSPNKSVCHYLYKLSMHLIKFSTFRSKIYICPMHPKST